MRTGADVIRAEGGIGRTVSDAILDCPCDCLGIILVSRHIVIKLLNALDSGEPAVRHRKVTICALVQPSSGANRLDDTPPVDNAKDAVIAQVCDQIRDLPLESIERINVIVRNVLAIEK